MACLAAALVVWAIGFLIVHRMAGRVPARLWLAVPVAVLLFDAAGGLLEDRDAGAALAMAVDGFVFAAVIAGALATPWELMRRLAALAGVLLGGAFILYRKIRARRTPYTGDAGDVPHIV